MNIKELKVKAFELRNICDLYDIEVKKIQDQAKELINKKAIELNLKDIVNELNDTMQQIAELENQAKEGKVIPVDKNEE